MSCLAVAVAMLCLTFSACSKPGGDGTSEPSSTERTDAASAVPESAVPDATTPDGAEHGSAKTGSAKTGSAKTGSAKHRDEPLEAHELLTQGSAGKPAPVAQPNDPGSSAAKRSLPPLTRGPCACAAGQACANGLKVPPEGGYPRPYHRCVDIPAGCSPPHCDCLGVDPCFTGSCQGGIREGKIVCGFDVMP